jgi:hypothetical protein
MVTTMAIDFDHAVPMYADFLKASYAQFRGEDTLGMSYDVQFFGGRNYLKVIHVDRYGHRSAHSFIVTKATDQFKIGDILKAATWNAPARNFVRGNICDQNYGNVNWAGA